MDNRWKRFGTNALNARPCKISNYWVYLEKGWLSTERTTTLAACSMPKLPQRRLHRGSGSLWRHRNAHLHHGKTCEKCGGEYGKLGHIWGDWQSSGDGKTHTRTCEVCDYTETAKIPATGGLLSPKTGDDSHIGMWAGILCVSLAGIIVLVVLYRKKHKK